MADDVGWEPGLSTARMVLWWTAVAAGLGMGIRLRHNVSKGWLLFKLINAVILAQALSMTAKALYEISWATNGDAPITDDVFLAYIPLSQLATSSFQGLLLLLASGYCITRADMGPHKPFVIGIPAVILVTGTITDYIYYRVTEDAFYEADLLDMSGWESALWFGCTFANVCALVLSWVYTFDILGQESEALVAQAKANTQRMVAEADGPQDAHAAPPPYLDAALEVEGHAAYKTLLGAGQNMSHIPGADVEAQEFQTVADRVNFDLKKRMYERFAAGVMVYLCARVCVLLLPIFYLNVVQTVIIFLDFLVQLGFLGTLAVLFRPVENSPYLMIGGSAEDGEAMGVADLDTALDMDPDDLHGPSPPVELAPAGAQHNHHGRGSKQGATSASGAAAAAAAAGDGAGKDQDAWRPPPGPKGGAGGGAGGAGGAAAADDLPSSRGRQAPAEPRLPPIRAAGPKFSLDDDDDLTEVQLGSSPPVLKQ